MLVTIVGLADYVLIDGGLPKGHATLLLTGMMWAAYAAAIRMNRVDALTATPIVSIKGQGTTVSAWMPTTAGAACFDIMAQLSFANSIIANTFTWAMAEFR